MTLPVPLRVVNFDTGTPTALNDVLLTPFDFGAKGDGIKDDSAAIQAAVNAAIAQKKTLYIPPASPGYLINTAINCTNIYGLTIIGSGLLAPTNALATSPPTTGSIFLGNTGTGNPVFDFSGSSNTFLKELAIICVGQSTPSTIGLLFATSTTSPSNITPGGANNDLDHVAVWMANANNSIPIAYINGAGGSDFRNIWTLGVYGLVISANNVVGVASPYVTIASLNIGVDDIDCMSSSLLGYGGQPPLLIEGSTNHNYSQLFIETINGGPGYSGQPYAIKMTNVTDIRIKVEVDSLPSVLHATGTMDRVDVSGTSFPGTTPVGGSLFAICQFDGTACDNSNFDVEISGALPNNNFWYGTVSGGSPTMNIWQNCRFLFNNFISTQAAFFNATNVQAIPFDNLLFYGIDNNSNPTITFQIAGVAATPDTFHHYINDAAPLQTFSPAVVSGTGTLTTVSAAGRFRRYGRLIWVEIVITITNNGTGATNIAVNLPANLAAASSVVLNGRENGVSGKQLQGLISSGAGFATIVNFDNSYPGASGASLIVSGMYEVAS